MKSKIEWTERTWNPVTGCTPISEGCDHCYARTMSMRLQAMGLEKYAQGFNRVYHEAELDRPKHWKKPSTIFVCSMSDLFHPSIPLRFIRKVFEAMTACPQHTFQVLTKRPAIMKRLVDEHLSLPRNVWLGVSVELQTYINRVQTLQSMGTPCSVKFLSCEPLLGPLDLDLDGIDWVIVGGESGPHARPMNPDWVRSIRDQCLDSNTPFFFKQWGGVNKKKAGRILDGRIWDEMPEKGVS